jgi:Flp pilus assembly protein CpaB
MSALAVRPRGLTGRISGGHLLTLAAGLLGAAATLTVLRSADDTVRITVAGHDLEPGARLAAGDLTTAEVGRQGEVTGRFVPADDAPALLGKVVIAPIARGDPLLASNLRDAAASDGLRAMSFAVETSRAVGGALDVSDRVDVLAADRDGAVGYVLVDAEVLARSTSGDGSPIRGPGDELTVTLSVDADGARRLASALAVGEITVVRSTGAEPLGAIGWYGEELGGGPST